MVSNGIIVSVLLVRTRTTPRSSRCLVNGQNQVFTRVKAHHAGGLPTGMSCTRPLASRRIRRFTMSIAMT